MFGYSVDEGKEKTVIYGNIYDIRRALTNVIPLGKVNQLFLSISMLKAEIYTPFLYELYHLLDAYITAYDTNTDGRKRFPFVRPVTRLRDKIREETWVKDTFVENEIDIPEKLDLSRIDDLMKFKILDHQKKTFDSYLEIKHRFKLRGFLLESGVGSGKTFQSLALTESLHSEVKIIICPLPTVYEVWVSSLIETIYKKPIKPYVFKDGGKYNGENYIVVHYEALSKFESIINKLPKGKKAIIIDESHNFNENKSDRSNKLIDVVNKVKADDVILMTGTAVKDHKKEVLVLLRLLDPRFTKYVVKRYTKFVMRGNGFVSDIVSKRFSLIRLKVDKKEMELPPLTEVNVPIKIPDSDKYLIKNIREDMKNYVTNRRRELYPVMDEFKKSYLTLREIAFEEALSNGSNTKDEFDKYKRFVALIVTYYEKGSLMSLEEEMSFANTYERKVLIPNLPNDKKALFREAKTLYKYPALKLLGEALGKIVTRARINCFKDIAKHIDYDTYYDMTTKKLIIFSNYIDVVREAEERTKRYGSLGIYGEHTKNLSSIVQEFTNNKKYTFLAATYKSMGTGVPVIAANIALMIDLPFRNYLYSQAIGRIHRLGQDKPCFVFKFILDTGEEQNISVRNEEIILLNADNVKKITGVEFDLEVEEDETKDQKDELEGDATIGNSPVIQGLMNKLDVGIDNVTGNLLPEIPIIKNKFLEGW